jgi:outer membrane protein assembly factor BamB
MSSFVGHKGKIISISDRGILNCLDATSGEIVQRKRIGGNFSSSPLLAGGHVYFCSREGIVSVVSLAAGFKTVATNRFEESIMASPAVFKNDLIIRTATKLIRIRGGESPAAGS